MVKTRIVEREQITFNKTTNKIERQKYWIVQYRFCFFWFTIYEYNQVGEAPFDITFKDPVVFYSKESAEEYRKYYEEVWG